jgi:hypothetical protein
VMVDYWVGIFFLFGLPTPTGDRNDRSTDD